jgi:hypothetical protein
MPQDGLSMFDYYISIGIDPYSIGAIGFAGGGGALAANSVSSSNIVDGTIADVDIADEAITPAKLDPTVKTFLTDIGQAYVLFSQQLNNLENPGFWGNLRIINDNSSDNGATLTITVQSEYYDAPTDSTDIIQRLASTTIAKNHHVDIPIAIDDRLTNRDTIIRMYYTINKNDIAAVSNYIAAEDDQGSDKNGDYFVLIFHGSYAEINGGNAEMGFTIADNI